VRAASLGWITSAQAIGVSLGLDPRLCGAQRRRFYRRMRRALLARGLVFHQRHGVCMVVPIDPAADDPCVFLVDWLVDQLETREVVVNSMRPALAYFGQDFKVVGRQKEPQQPRLQSACRDEIRHVLYYALLQLGMRSDAIRGRLS
jgi:hypothetical protein